MLCCNTNTETLPIIPYSEKSPGTERRDMTKTMVKDRENESQAVRSPEVVKLSSISVQQYDYY